LKVRIWKPDKMLVPWINKGTREKKEVWEREKIMCSTLSYYQVIGYIF
jgi:hypothetical protein